MKSLLKKVAVAAGAGKAIRAANKGQLRILMYHRFPDSGGLLHERILKQCRHLKRHYDPVPLSVAARCISERQTIPDRWVAVTVDDGYRDFAAAWPAFRAANVPVTLFAVSAFVDGGMWLWPDVVEHCLQTTALERLDIELPDGSRFEHPLRNTKERALADCALDQRLLALSDVMRRRVIETLPEATGVTLPGIRPDRYAALTWPTLREMRAEGLDVGAHTRTHPVVSRLASDDGVRDEIAGSKLAIEKALDAPVENFCYPNGTAADYDQRCIEAVREAGFGSAVTAIRGMNGPASSAFELRRIGVEPGMPPDMFELEVAGYRMS